MKAKDKFSYREKHFNTNFFVYMVNLKHSDNHETVPDYEKTGDMRPNSVLSYKKDSSTKKIKPEEKCEIRKSPLSLRRRITSRSKMPASASNLPSSYTKCSHLQNDTRKHWGVDLFKKFIGKPKSNKDNKLTSASESLEELYLGSSVSSKEAFRDRSVVYETEDLLNISPLDDQYGCIDFSGLREITEFANNIQDSENHIKDMIIKYISDKTLESELMSAICGHGKLLLDSERRTLNISSETWYRQAEMFKEQQKSLQNTIDSLISQNRDMQYDYDAIVNKNEKLCAKIIYLQESTEVGLTKNNANNTESMRIVEDLKKHNDQLRHRLNYMTTRNEDFEEALRKTHRKMFHMQQQMRSANTLLQTTKNSHDRTKHDYELEIAKLHQQVQDGNNSVKEAVEAGDVLLDDLDSMETQLKAQTKCINWEKFKKRGKSLIDLIHLSRTCINELGKELVTKTNEFNVLAQENECLKVDNEEKKLAVKNLEVDRENGRRVAMECKELEMNLKNMVAKCEELECKCTRLQKENDEHKSTIEDKARQQRRLEENVKSLSVTIGDKNEMLDQLRSRCGNWEQERESLRAQISGMSQVLSATGSGDISKELAATQEKLSKVQAQYFAIISEKTCMLKKMESYDAERETLIAYQKTCYEQMQLMRKDIESHEKANRLLTEQLEHEKKTVSALQTERVRHLEERTVLTAIYERLRSEVSKNDQLEGAVCTMNQKAKELAMIAGYNKKLGEHLKSQVVEKEEAISELQHNVKELTDIHVETTKEKVALCEELAQVFNIKEVLDNKLTVEMERSALLGESKREIEYAVNTQLQEIHGKYEREHWALKLLSKNIKSVVSQRNALEIINEENKQKILKLCKANATLMERQKKLIKDNEDYCENLLNLREGVSANDLVYEETITHLTEKLDVYKETIATMKNLIEPMNVERDRLKESIEYLQNNLNNLRGELNLARESAISYKNSMVKEKEIAGKLRNEFDKKIQDLSDNYLQNEEQVALISKAYHDLREEYNHINEDTNRFKMILSEKFPSTRHSTATVSSTTFPDDELIVELQEKNRLLELEKSAFAEVVVNLKQENEKLMKEQCLSQDKLNRISEQFEETLQNVIVFDKSYRCVAPIVDGLNGKQEQELNKIKEKLNFYKIKLNGLNGDKNDLQNALDETTAKLVETMRMLCAEKQAREYVEENLKRCEEKRDELSEEVEAEYNKLCQKEKLIKEMGGKIARLEVERNDLKCALERTKSKLEYVESCDNISKASKTTYIDASLDDEDTAMRIESLKTQLKAKYNEISRLEDGISTLESKCALMEFQRCESLLRLHDVQARMQAAFSKNKELKSSVLTAVTDLCNVKEEGGDLSNACMRLCATMQELIGVEEELETPRESNSRASSVGN